jgi:hypothetical protein
VKLAQMPDKSDWLMRPVDRGYCRYESLKDGTLDLLDVLRMNNAISVKDENDRRLRKK